MFSISLTNQEWIVLFAVTIALIVFIGAVICILYVLMGALRSEEACEEVHTVSMVQNKAKVCPVHPEGRKTHHALDKVVLEMEADKEPIRETELQASYTQIIKYANSPSAASPESAETMPSPTDEDSSTLDVEFEKKSAKEYERRLAESEFLMKKLREQLAGHSKNDRKVKFVDEPEIMTGMPPSPASPEALSPVVEPFWVPKPAISPIFAPKPFAEEKPFWIPEPAISPIFAPKSFAEEKPLNSKSVEKPLLRGQRPPLKSFTPPRSLTPQCSAPDQAALLMAPQKPKTFASRRTFKRPYSSIDKPVVHQLIFE